MSGRGSADSEYGWDCHHMPRARNRQRKNWPGSACSFSSRSPAMYTETMPGASGRSPATRNRCRPSLRSGVITRYQSTSAATAAYMADQATRSSRLATNEAPLANWWLNASAMAR